MSIFRIKRFAKTDRRNKRPRKPKPKPNFGPLAFNDTLDRLLHDPIDSFLDKPLPHKVDKPKKSPTKDLDITLVNRGKSIKFPTISKSTLKKVGIGTAIAGGTALGGKLAYDEYRRRQQLDKVSEIRELLEKKFSKYNPDEGVIRVRRPHIEISSSSSSSSYDSENPKDNYYYENNRDYDSDLNPDGYEEEIIATPRGESKRSSSILERIIGDKESTKEIGKLLLTNMTGTAAGMVLGKHIIDKFKKDE